MMHASYEVDLCVFQHIFCPLVGGVAAEGGEGFSQGLTEVKVSVRVVLLISLTSPQSVGH